MNELNILSEAFDKIKNYIQENNDSSIPVVNFKTPKQLNSQIDFSIKESSVSEKEFLNLLDKYLEFSVRTGNKQFLNQLYSGFNFPAFIGEVFSVLANTSMYTYEVAPVATTIETHMIKLMNSYAGYENGDGLFVTGGSNANLIAMFSARNKAMPEIRFKGYRKEFKLTAFVNENAHYSFETAANVLGIGSENVIKVKADKNGKLIPSELEKEILSSIKRGETPFFVAATCATTLTGAYDPIDGSLLLSKKHRSLMKGIEKTDSFAWNPHKLMNIPLVCSVLLVSKRGTLQYNLTDINTDYIFHNIDEIEDLGKKSIQCGRKVDAVKLWFAWKYFGLNGYESRIDNLIDVAKYAENKVVSNPNLELVASRQSFTLCFRYIPKTKTDINKFNLELREILRKSGKSIVNFGYIGKDLSLRLVAANGELSNADIDLFFKHIEQTANILENERQENK